MSSSNIIYRYEAFTVGGHAVNIPFFFIEIFSNYCEVTNVIANFLNFTIVFFASSEYCPTFEGIIPLYLAFSAKFTLSAIRVGLTLIHVLITILLISKRHIAIWRFTTIFRLRYLLLITKELVYGASTVSPSARALANTLSSTSFSRDLKFITSVYVLPHTYMRATAVVITKAYRPINWIV